MMLARAPRALALGAVLALFALAAFAPGLTAQATDGPKVSLDAEDAALPGVLKILAEKGGLNIITGPGVTNDRITIHMRDVPIDQAVNLVVRAAGLAYERIGNSILVADKAALKDETGLSSYVVDLRYADANEVKNALASLKADVTVDKGGNRLIVVTSPRVLSEITTIVTRMDVPAKQVMLEARVVEVSTDDVKRLGIDWDMLTRQGFVFVEGNYDSLTGSSGENENTTFSGINVFPNTPGTHDVWQLKNFSRVGKTFRAAVDLLVRDGNARVLANPKLATLNGHEASMLIGSRIPYVVSGTVFAGGAAAPTQRIEKEEVGVKLKITPLINADGYITTTITPEVSSVTGFKGPNADLPIVATRQATTTVRLKDGNSVIIGGLLTEEKTSTVSKVPILGSIPGLGYLFQHQSIQTKKTDLVIEITPRILPDQQ